MLYIDSNIFLYPIIYEPELVEEAQKSKALLLKIALGEVEAYTSIITWDEVIRIVRKNFGVEPSIEQGKRFLEFPNLKFLTLKRGIILKAQELLEKYKVKPRDAIHIATAIENKITSIASYDKDLDVVAEIKG